MVFLFDLGAADYVVINKIKTLVYVDSQMFNSQTSMHLLRVCSYISHIRAE